MKKNDSFEKAHINKEILMKDEQTNAWYYEDHITAIVKRAEKEGAFENLSGYGKPLKLDENLVYNPLKQLHKTMKDNNILPNWIRLGKEIDQLLADLETYESEYNIRKTVESINKKVTEHNFSCPPSAQRRKVILETYLKP
ncbi:enterochelin esterase [Fictibacillus aquaticus]|uniref:Enterochelin esterase n=2 Tax=Fictibacillus aquaticus TaxID=2021314 RepID=A0A235FCX5_9BACL|nr:DUF1992 domain-containing protein [Fictibacillus aquaticus]OYD59176.1 enterochelin esterase [Fictibacillus aquaticus]